MNFSNPTGRNPQKRVPAFLWTLSYALVPIADFLWYPFTNHIIYAESCKSFRGSQNLGTKVICCEPFQGVSELSKILSQIKQQGKTYVGNRINALGAVWFVVVLSMTRRWQG